MEFLNNQEKIQLQRIFRRSSLLRTADERSNFLEFCNLTKYCDLQLEQPPNKFGISLLLKLSKIEITVGNSHKLGLVIFLEYLSQIDSNLSTEEKHFIQEIINQCERSRITSLLAEGRNNSSSSFIAQQTIKIDRGLIVNYNLEKLVATFRQKVGYEGVFVFSVGGDRQILEQYIVKRLRQEFKQKMARQNKQIEIRLSRDRIVTSADIENKLLNKYQLNCFSDLFKAECLLDTMLIIWNYDIPQKKIKLLALEFCKNFENTALPYLQNTSRCFVIIWANVNKKPLTGFNTLYTPKQFELSNLIPWVRSQLKNKGIEKQQIEHYLNRLKDQEAHLIKTYQEINLIISELQNISRLYE